MSNEPIFKLPPFTVEQVMVSMSETIDWGLKMIGAPDAWKKTKGAGIKVAVLDSGVDTTHKDLKGAIAKARDFSGSRVGYDDQVCGHGTHVAGLIGARSNGVGVVGVAPECELLIAKVLGDDGYGSIGAIAGGIEWAVNNGADVISMSLGSASGNDELHGAIKDAAKAGVFVIAAAGNSGPDLGTVDFPGKYAETIAVGAIDNKQKVAYFSSRGPQVDIVAPGDKILSTYPPNGYAVLSGTSMATPIVSGVIALMLSEQKRNGTIMESVDNLRKALKDTSIDLGAPGRDSHYGYGLIDPDKLLAK